MRRASQDAGSRARILTGGVKFQESGAGKSERSANSARLEAAVQPGMGATDEARLACTRCGFERRQASRRPRGLPPGTTRPKGSLELAGTGAEVSSTPRDALTDRIAVDAAKISTSPFWTDRRRRRAGSVKRQHPAAREAGRGRQRGKAALVAHTAGLGRGHRSRRQPRLMTARCVARPPHRRQRRVCSR